VAPARGLPAGLQADGGRARAPHGAEGPHPHRAPGAKQQPATPDTALRLARVFGATPEFWLNLQAQHDLSKAAIAQREELAKIDTLTVG
jgi:hypothetical protein